MTDNLVCGYELSDGLCGAPIRTDAESYSGYTHVHAADWLHWASPVPYGQGLTETSRIFCPCAVCGKLGPDNEAHIRYDGHKFTAGSSKGAEKLAGAP